MPKVKPTPLARSLSIVAEFQELQFVGEDVKFKYCDIKVGNSNLHFVRGQDIRMGGLHSIINQT